VNVYKLISRGTIEEKILKLQEKKQGLFDILIDESGGSFKELS
jgi:SNF2 family DNA or RNA helicase